MDLAVYIDAAEERILTDRIARLVNGNDWDLVESTYGYLDPLTYTSFLLPYTMTKEWEDQYTGNYARLQPTDYDYYTTTGAYLADVVAQNVRSSGDTYTYSASSVPFIAQTKAEYPMNRPVYISLYTSNVGNSSFRMLECGWGGNTGLGGNDLSCRFWSSGNVEFWRGSKFIGNCNYTDNSKPTNPPKGENIPPPVEQIATATLDIHLIPFRKNEILIVTNRGRTHFVVPDVDINETTPTICASGNFWWYVPNGLVQVQCAPIKFVTAGTLVTSPYTYRTIPTSGA